MQIRIQQLNPTVGALGANSRKILSALERAENEGINLLILPEMCTCGYTPLDLLERPDFQTAVDEINQKIIASTKATALIFGSITPNRKAQEKPSFNAALMAQHGGKIAEIHKALLPTYDVFDEARYFEPGDSFKPVKWQGKKWGITICEDIWANHSGPQRYSINPVQQLADQDVDAIINISASPFTVSKSEDSVKMLRENVLSIHCPIFYANQAGAHTSLISNGDSMALDARGNIIVRAPLFKEAFIDVMWNEADEIEAANSTSPKKLPGQMERIFRVLQQGLKDYLQKTGVTSDVILGISGGIDSALGACIAVEALGAEHVLGAALPSEFSSEGSVTDARKLAQNLDIELREIPIKSIYDEYLSALRPLFEGTEFGTAEENLQARIRGVLLMAVANKFNRFLLNSGNKSEIAVGYCTLYGDTNGSLAIISDLYKTEVYELARWLNDSYYKKPVIPQEILEKPPSAELKPDQKDSDRLPEYETLDAILKLYIESQQSISDIIRRGFEKPLVEKVIQLIHASEYKRHQVPPGLKIHEKSFGAGRHWPVVSKQDFFNEAH
jgi:NAD+ synthetase